ncbi:MAG: SDR family oxidoreductase [Candidatus Tectomicrobia bacterium]
MDFKLEDKVIMVAASSKGLGFGIAEAVAREGARVSLASRRAAAIEHAASVLRDRFGVEARGYTFDATNADAIERWCASTLDDFGAVDGLVVNAGGPPAGTFDTFDDEAWTSAFHLTLLSAVRMVRAVLPVMKNQQSGSILTVTSTSFKEPNDMLLLSNVFRSGVVSLVKTLSRDLAPHGIRINNLVPGRMDTDRVRSLDQMAADKRGLSVEQQQSDQQQAIPMGRYGTIQEFGSAAAFLLSDAANYITGTTLIVDGGKTRTVW